jgi:putative signal transducing protein
MKRTEAEETFVKLVTASGMPEADLWKAVLEAAGITVFLRNEAVGPLLGVTSDTLGAVDLWVPRDDAARALEVLQDERIESGVDEEEG